MPNPTYIKQDLLTEISQLSDFKANPFDPDFQANHLDRADDLLRVLRAALTYITEAEKERVEPYRRAV